MVQLYRFTQFLFSLMLATALSPLSGFSQAQVSQLCNLDDFQPSNGHSVYLNNLPGSPSPLFVFDAQGGTITSFTDGTALISGTVVHETQSNLQWEVNVWLNNKRDFNAWTALGRGIKIELAPPAVVSANSINWDFYELDDTKSTLVGVPGTFYDGDTLNLSHRPSNFGYGFQVGIGANAKNGNDGISGWFFYSGAYTGIGDINVNRDCGVPTCDVEITQIDATCINDTSFEVSVSFTGTGTQFEITDNQGRAPLSVLTAGTYTYSSYTNNTNVQLVVTDMSVASCADTSNMVTKDCTPPTVCDVAIDSLATLCLNDSSFQVSVFVSGTGSYTIDDNQSLAAQTGGAGVYVFGPYPNNLSVSFSAVDNVLANCSANAGPVTNDCTPPVVCDVAIDSLSSLCLNDSTFEVSVFVSGTGNYTIADDQGLTAQTGGAGTYVFGPYTNNTNVSFSATDNVLLNCVANAGPITKDCTPVPPVCDLAIDSVETVCLTDSTFEVTLVLTGTPAAYQVDDDQGSPSQSGATSYTFGPYLNNTSVSFTAFNTDFPTCTASAGPVTADCAPDTCAISIDDLVAECASDTSFQIMVTFSGIGNNFSISDNVGSTPMRGLSPGTYAFGDYFNSTDVFITVSDSSFSGCTSTLGPVTADCTPVPVCDIALDTSYTNCLTDSTFEVVVSFTGTGNFFQIFDNRGTPGITNLAAGTYSFGEYPSNSQVQLTILDFAIFNCFAVTPVLTTVCDTSGGNGVNDGISNFTSELFARDINLSWQSPLRTSGTYYQVERKEGVGEFEVIGERKTSEMDLFENKYFFTDYAIQANMYYTYRIRQVRASGQVSFSKTIQTIRLDEREMLIGTVYPNPSQGYSKIKMNAGSPHRVTCELLDGKGALVSKSVINTVVGTQELQLPSNGLRPGLYLVRLTLESKEVFVRKLIITE